MPRWTTSVVPLSSERSRYLPRRPTPLMLRPSSSARNCLADACRRTDRPLATATALIRRPVTSFARSWRRVSTSGSSGTGQLRERPTRRFLLGVLLGRSLPGPPQHPGDEDLGDVGPVVVRSRADEHVAGHPLAEAHRQ